MEPDLGRDDEHDEHDEHDEVKQHLHFVSYWQLLGKVISAFCLPLTVFTILLALKVDGIIQWNYWYVLNLYLILSFFHLVCLSPSLFSLTRLGIVQLLRMFSKFPFLI
jgi:hypothetical protein